MLVVRRRDFGDVAFSRLARDGMVHDVLGEWALPADVPSTRALREHRLAPLVPPHVWVTGLAALWLHGLAPAPAVLDVAGIRGAHRAVPAPGSPPLVLHTGPTVGLPDAGSPKTATVTRACVEALWHSPADLALPPVLRAVREGATSVDELKELALRLVRHTRALPRVASLVDGVVAAA